MPTRDFLFARYKRKIDDFIPAFHWKSALWWCFKYVMLYVAQDIPAFVMHCVYGASRSSLLILLIPLLLLLLLSKVDLAR